MHPLQNWKNPFKNSAKEYFLGLFLVTGSSMLSECSATLDIDWLAIDMEASQASRLDMLHIAQSLNGSTAALLVRVAENNQQYIEAALDIGAHGIIVPKISNNDEAAKAVNACYYHPFGTRGLNPIRCSAYFGDVNEYLQKAKTVSCFLQIETVEALENLDAIAAVPGVSGLFIGCGDLAMNLGIPGQFEHPEFQSKIAMVLTACQKYNLIPGIFAYSNQLAKKYLQCGFKMLGLGNEIKFLRAGIESSINDVKSTWQVRLKEKAPNS